MDKIMMEGQLLEAKSDGCGMFIEVVRRERKDIRKLISVDSIISIEEEGDGAGCAVQLDGDYVVDVKDSYSYFKEKLKDYIL